MANERIAVVGAGIMGLWSALLLREAGHDVVLVDGWGSGHARAASGGESRVIRCGYGGTSLYAAWAQRALRIWEDRQRSWATSLFHRTGVLWLVAGDPRYASASLRTLERLRVRHERIPRRGLARRYPQIRTDGVAWALLEPDAGALMARKACLAITDRFERDGGTILREHVTTDADGVAGTIRGSRLLAVRLSSGKMLRADRFLFACGAWLPALFPRLLRRRIRVTRKDVFFFGTPPGDDRFLPPRQPVWLELGTGCYGVPPLDGRGFKLHPDLPGARIDPSKIERRPSSRMLREARACLARRFPDLAAAPLLESRVCQYAATPDRHLLLDRVPGLDNAWIAGGGSGHGFKHGPVIGELAAEAVGRNRADLVPEPLRLGHRPAGDHF